MTSRRKNIFLIAAWAAAAALAGFLILTSPWTWSLTHSIPPAASENEPADIDNGRRIFVASDCATCHITTGQDNDEHLGGGIILDSQFGRFHMPNISPHPEHGTGNWTLAEFDRAIREGVGPRKILPDGQNLYPAFPYTSYVRLKPEDVRDLYAYMMTLPASDKKVPPHELKFPYNIRRGVGVWRLMFLDGKSVEEIGLQTDVLPADADVEQFKLGRYLVESAGHCVECHSPRSFIGHIPRSLRYAGGPDPEGTGYFLNITPDETGIASWSKAAMTERGEPKIDPNTDQVWQPVTLRAWSDATELNLDQNQLWAYSRDAYRKSCSSCHSMPKEEDYSANQWIGTMRSMERFISFSDDEYRLILAYLQNRSADLGPRASTRHAGGGDG